MSRLHSLADTVRAMDSTELAELLTLRPDLCRPEPADLDELVDRLASRASTEAALADLNVWQLRVAQALAAYDDASLQQLADGLGTAIDEVQVGLADLRARALVWGDPPHLAAAARTALGPYPLGLAAPSPHALATGDIQAALSAIEDAERAVLDRLVWGPPVGAVRHADRVVSERTAHNPIERLLAHHLLRPLDADHVVLPREVALELRRGRWFADSVSSKPPSLAGTPQGLGASLQPELIDRAGIGSAQELVAHLIVVVEELGDHQPQTLRTGGLGRREMTRLLGLVGDNEQLLQFVLTLAANTGVLVSQAGHWMASAMLDEFGDAGGFGRWAMLLDGWRTLGAWPPAEPASALDPGCDEAWAARARSDLADVLARSAPGQSVTPEGLTAWLAWRHPAWRQLDLAAVARRLLTEAGWLGLVAFGRRSVLAGRPIDDPGFSPQGDRVILQSDLTAVAPAPLDRRTGRQLLMMAHRESHGATATFRFTPASVRHALDAGWTKDAILDWLTSHTLTDVPQPLRALVDEVARTHGRVRVQAAGAIVQFDDEASAVSLLRHPRAAELGLRQFAPGVVAAAADPADVVEVLRALGLAPVAESAAGERFLTPAVRRAPAPARLRPPASDPDEIASRLAAH